MANKRIVELGKKTRFTSENQPKNSGRKPKLYNIAKKADGLSYEEYKEMRMYLMNSLRQNLKSFPKPQPHVNCHTMPFVYEWYSKRRHKDTFIILTLLFTCGHRNMPYKEIQPRKLL